MKILVIEDSPWNVTSANETLKGHDVTVVNTVVDGFQALKERQDWDAVLTDLYLPTPGKVPNYLPSSGVDDGHLGDQIPAGLVFAIAANNYGVPHVAILTDSDHHRDRICALLDLLRGQGPGKIQRFEARTYCVSTYDPNPERAWGPWFPLFYDPTNSAVVEDQDTPGCRPIKDWGYCLHTLVSGELDRPKI